MVSGVVEGHGLCPEAFPLGSAQDVARLQNRRATLPSPTGYSLNHLADSDPSVEAGAAAEHRDRNNPGPPAHERPRCVSSRVVIPCKDAKFQLINLGEAELMVWVGITALRILSSNFSLEAITYPKGE